MNTSKVSVVMATYNGEKYLREQLDSILAQTYSVYEIVIQDDCSDDSTVDIIREYIARHNNIRLSVNTSNIGVNENFRLATMRATGDLICFADQDDVWLPEKVERQVAAIGDNAMCFSYHWQGYDMEHAVIVKYKCAPERQMFNAVVGHSMILKRSFIQDKESWFECGYYDQWISAYAHLRGGVVAVEEPLNFHRSHEGQASSSPKSRQFSQLYPYLCGAFKYRKLQKNIEFVTFYTRLKTASEGVNTLVNHICTLLLTGNPLAFLKLSFICMIHRKTIYPGDVSGWTGYIRGFFFPCIFATYFIDHEH